jgi:hypothetical protein
MQFIRASERGLVPGSGILTEFLAATWRHGKTRYNFQTLHLDLDIPNPISNE